MFPLADDNPRRSAPILTVAIIAICIGVYIYQLTLSERETEHLLMFYGFVPALAFGPMPLADAAQAILTSMFLHGSILHIAGNMLFLWIFGDNVEDTLGKVKYLLLYLVAGAAAAVAQGLTDTASPVPMIGASGAISGVLAAYWRLFPNAPVRVVLLFGIFSRIVSMPASFVIGAWFLLQIISGLIDLGAEGGVAFWAHVGGFIAGLMLTPLLRPRR